MSQAALKLVVPDPSEQDSLLFERRASRRRVASGSVTSIQKTPDPLVFNNRISSVQLLDISHTGLGGVVEKSVEPGTSITVFFPPHGPEPGFDRHGYISRCTKSPNGYIIGVHFYTKSAA